MPPFQHTRTDSQNSYPRASIIPPSASGTFGQSGMPSTNAAGGSSSMSAAKSRQYATLHAQLAQLNSNLADTENLLRMTAVQAGDMRFLGGYVGGMFMGSAKVLGDEGVKGNADIVVKKEEEE